VETLAKRVFAEECQAYPEAIRQFGNPDFHCEGHAVGYFLMDEFPEQDGKYEYMPYRGMGHYALAKALESGQRAECYFDKAGHRYRFSVVDEKGRADHYTIRITDLRKTAIPIA
jgi:hypothetical protein